MAVPLTRCRDVFSPVVVRGLDADQLGQAVEIGDVPGSHGGAGHQVVQDAADVDHHLAGRRLLVAVAWQLGHQVVHHLGGCAQTQTHDATMNVRPLDVCRGGRGHREFGLADFVLKTVIQTVISCKELGGI